MAEQKNKSGAGKFFLGAALGALAGAVAGHFMTKKSENECDCGEDCDCEDCEHKEKEPVVEVKAEIRTGEDAKEEKADKVAAKEVKTEKAAAKKTETAKKTEAAKKATKKSTEKE